MSTGLLLSGGLDSIALAWWLRPTVAYTVDYGQRAAGGEIRAASAVCAALEIHHEILRTSVGELGSGDMSSRPALKLAPRSDWWPFRNQLLLTVTAMRAVADGISELLIGTVKDDRQHKDGTAEFVIRMNDILKCQEGQVGILAPGLGLTSCELIARCKVPPEILCWAHSCHTGEYACGTCRGCRKHFNVTQALWNHGY